MRILLLPLIALTLAFASLPSAQADPVHTTYLWHMHQPIYWPNPSVWTPNAYEFAYETITNNTAQNDVFTIFNSDDRVQDYQGYPKTAVQSILGHPDAGAQVSFAGSLIQNINSLAAAGWNGGRYASNWYQPYRDAKGWTTSGGRSRYDPVVVAFHHSINPLIDEEVFRKMIETQKSIMPATWTGATSTGFFPAEMCFSERLIPILVEQGIQWSIVPDIHIARACADYPSQANLDNCDPPNPADQINPAQGSYDSQTISRGVTVRIPTPFALQPHYAQYVDPSTGSIDKLVVVPAANAMSWDEGYGLYGTGDIDRVAPTNDPARPMLVVFAHDGDNAWQGGNSYYTQNVSQFTNAAAANGYEPSTIAEYLAGHPVPLNDVVKVEDGGWVNADGDFGSPQFINWNWPLVNSSGQFDIPNGWAEDERNWAVLTAAVNRVVTADQIAGPADITRVVDPTLSGSTSLDKAWHFLLAGHESGYMYYGTALDMEVKPTLASNAAVAHADVVIPTGTDQTGPTLWIPQRFPWNPGGYGGGALWGYPGGNGAIMTQDFHVWTFAYDVSGISSVTLYVREDNDGTNPLASTQNETYAGGAEVGSWTALPMNQRAFPAGNVYNNPEINFSVMPTYIADQYWYELTGYDDVLLDYYVEAIDTQGNVKKSPIQHVYVGTGGTSGGAAVSWDPQNPAVGDTLTVTYDLNLGVLNNATNPVYIHIGHSGWTQVITPDPAMTYDGVNDVWTYDYMIPGTATTVDFVFNDGAGNWDNNGGADWHVSVTGGGGGSPPFVIDGTLDAGAPLVSSCGTDLYASYDGTYLYMAAPVAAGQDRFFFVNDAYPTGLQLAPWNKAGQTAPHDLLLGNEESNNWAGWFDALGSGTTTGVDQASGAYLEALVEVGPALGGSPGSIWIAHALYDSPDAGVLMNQVPCGNGNGDLENTEWIEVSAPVSGTPFGDLGRHISVSILSGNPSPRLVRARVFSKEQAIRRAEVFDVRGQLVETLYRGTPQADLTLGWDARSHAAGVYFLRIQGEKEVVTQRVVLLP